MTELISQEPPDGDFASYIEAIVGPPPEDPENAAREISEQLALRSKDNIEIMNAISPSHNQAGRDSADTTFVRRGPLSTGGAGLPLQSSNVTAAKARQSGQPELPDLAAAMQQAAQRGTSGLRRLFASVARLLIGAGIIWLAGSFVLADQFPGLTPVPGIALLFLGFALSNMAKGSSKR